MTQGLDNIIQQLELMLTASGFTPMTEFSAVDSLLHTDEMLGVICIENSAINAEALSNNSMNRYIECDHEIKLRLYGCSGDFVDYYPLANACYELFYAIAANENILVRKMDISKTVQSMPLKRLERIITLSARTYECRSLGEQQEQEGSDV
ncbi:MAG: hypothetical protein J5956_06950 [Ruminococcus sp.]|nr:hypothetical protein [Ruminococcus sp.]